MVLANASGPGTPVSMLCARFRRSASAGRERHNRKVPILQAVLASMYKSRDRRIVGV
ncbi:MAG: hypothetical protein R2720_04045 [Candidatus Nanopelagicales bacterium]